MAACPQCGEDLQVVQLPTASTLRRYSNTERLDKLEAWARTPPLFSPSCQRAFWPYELVEAAAGRWDRGGLIDPRNDNEDLRERLNRLCDSINRREELRDLIAKQDSRNVRDVMEVVRADDN